MSVIFERPKPSEVAELQSMRLYFVANPIDNLWQGLRNFQSRAFMPNQENAVVLLEDLELTYWPEHPQDFKEHPVVHRALEFINYKVQYNALTIGSRAAGRFFFRVHPSWKAALLDGRRTHQDLYAEFARNNPVFHHGAAG